ncbi:hypothetical protein KBY58_04580 [Cyanobium sp. HWJ4-Hawea]|nr:hypothetical protein [Cyanobium sp. WAJ14-Wanaka]MCP9808706.1 hypothetical protein [Cyanobium sp. HWJ4-Hawea]
MRVTHLHGEHLINLTSQEASALVDACTMVLLASQAAPEAKLPANVTRVLADVFENLQSTALEAQAANSEQV